MKVNFKNFIESKYNFLLIFYFFKNNTKKSLLNNAIDKVIIEKIHALFL